MSHTAVMCAPAVVLQPAGTPGVGGGPGDGGVVQAGRVSNIVWPPSQESAPVQPWATKSIVLVWNCTPKVGMVLWPEGPTIVGQPAVLMLLLVVQFGST